MPIPLLVLTAVTSGPPTYSASNQQVGWNSCCEVGWFVER